jgi:copper(I)-binding protein
MKLLPLAAVALLASCTAGKSKIEAQEAWARATTSASQPAVVYLQIANSGSGEDRLQGVATDIGAASLHSSSMSGGVMRMRAIDGMDIPAKSTIKFEPMGNHIMVEGLKAPLAGGSSFPLTLRFRSSPPQTVTVLVRSGAEELEHHAH